MLKVVNVSPREFNEFYFKWKDKIKIADLKDYINGYQDRGTFYAGHHGQRPGIVCLATAAHISGLLMDDEYEAGWSQVVLRCVDASQRDIVKDGKRVRAVTGSEASKWLDDILKKYYEEEEIEEAYETCSIDCGEIQIHDYNYQCDESNVVVRYTNCYYYDINGAYAKALCDIFPRAKDEFLEYYRKRKEYPEYKSYFNYSVGNMVNHGHRGTYNWIVDRVSRLMRKKVKETGGTTIYINTDGFFVSWPDKLIKTSNELGDFKCEYHGDIYFYRHDTTECRYTIYQCGDEFKGTLLEEGRDYIDLSKGIIIDAVPEKTEIGTRYLTNIAKRKVEIVNG